MKRHCTAKLYCRIFACYTIHYATLQGLTALHRTAGSNAMQCCTKCLRQERMRHPRGKNHLFTLHRKNRLPDSDCIFFSLTLEGMMVASTVYSLLTPSSEIVTVTLTESSFPNATPYTALCSSVFIVIEEKRRQQSECTSASTERMQATDSRAHKQKMGGPSRHTLVASLSSRAEDRGSVCTNKQTSVNTSNCFLYSHVNVRTTFLQDSIVRKAASKVRAVHNRRRWRRPDLNRRQVGKPVNRGVPRGVCRAKEED